MGNYRIKGINRKKRKKEKDRMPVSGRSVFIIQEAQKKRDKQILRKKRRRKEKERSNDY